MDLVVGTDTLLTNGFVNKFDVFCEVRTVTGGQGRNCSMDGWTTTRPATNCQLELGLIQMFTTSLVQIQEDMEKYYKGINLALLSVVL
jgi:hypothetical protein